MRDRLLRVITAFAEVANHAREVVVEAPWGFDLLPSETALASRESRRVTADEFILRRQLAHLDGYDAVLVDCTPSLGLLTINALAAASHCVVVTEPSYVLAAHRQIGWALLCLGRPVAAREHLTAAVALYERDRSSPLGPLYGAEPGIGEHVPCAWASWFLGLTEEALAMSRHAVARADRSARSLTRAYALGCDAMLHQFQRDDVAARRQAEAALAVAAEHEIPLWRAWASVLLGWALSQQGEADEGIATMRWGIDAARQTGAEWGRPYFMAILAEAYGTAGRPDQGLEAIAAALESAERNDERFFEAEIHRVRGMLLLESGAPPEAAERAFRRGLDVSRLQGSRSLELRCALELEGSDAPR